MDEVEPWMLEAVRACGPDERPLRELVLETMRRDRQLVEAIANGEEHVYEGSLATLERFTERGSWPEHDEGWVSESAGLFRHSYWMPGERPDRWDRPHRGADGRPNREFTTRCVVACFLLGDLEFNSTFGSGSDEPSAYTSLILVDGVTRLGEAWERALVRWLAWVSAKTLQEPSDLADSLQTLAPMFLLGSRVNALRGERYPLQELLAVIEAVFESASDGADDEDRLWLVDSVGYLRTPMQLSMASDALLEPVLARLAEPDRSVVRGYLDRLRAQLPLATRRHQREEREARGEEKIERRDRARDDSDLLRVVQELLENPDLPPEELAELKDLEADLLEAAALEQEIREFRSTRAGNAAYLVMAPIGFAVAAVCDALRAAAAGLRAVARSGRGRERR